MSIYDMPTFIRVTQPRAAREHTCGECFRVIPIGSFYNRHKGVWDGEWHTYKLCGRCQGLADQLGEFGYGDVIESALEECLIEASEVTS